MSADKTLISRTATEMVALLDKGEVTPLDALDALEARIAEVDPQLNALPTLCFDRARDRATAMMKKPVSERGVLKGLPVPIKDLTDVEGVRTTYGSPIFSDNIPARSDVMIELMEARGAVIYAKSNTPEFGAGASTFNEVFGRTLNPWNTGRSPAGSSGGAAAALASGMAWVAQGSDMGGSLRNPASFCGVVGLRPSPGRVPSGPAALPWDSLGVEGPMARNVPDLALLLDAMSGHADLDPLSFATEPGVFTAPRPVEQSRERSPSAAIWASPRSTRRWRRSARRRHVASRRWVSSSRMPVRTSPAPRRCSRPCAPSISPRPSTPCSKSTATCLSPT